MSVPGAPPTGDIASHLLAHLDEQLRSMARLRTAVDELGAAVRARDVLAVLRHTGTIEAEQTFRGTLDERRGVLLRRGAQLLGIEPWEVTVTALCALVDPRTAETVLGRSDELRRATEDVAREHRINRTLMQQELAFLDHLLRLGGAPPEPTYVPHGAGRYRAGGTAGTPVAAGATTHRHGLDLRA